MEPIEYASLYEYLGRRAGMELGQQVFQEAKKQRVKCRTQEVNQGGYSGKVMTYPIIFLKGYFSNIINTNSTTIEAIAGNINDYNTY